MPAGRSRPSSRVALAAAALACGLVIASCAPSTTQAAPPSSSPTVSARPRFRPARRSPCRACPARQRVGAGAVDRAVHAAPSRRRPSRRPKRRVEEPPPAPEPAEPPQVDDPADDFVQTEEPAAPAPAPAPAQVTGGKVVVIDPGHNGANGANPGIINALVDAGFGETKACNTTGTSTNAGYPEHEFTWAVANDLQAMLEAQGVTVIMTRDSDDGVGPCVNKRAAIGNNANADAVVSIHGDGVDVRCRHRVLRHDGRAPTGRRRDGRPVGRAGQEHARRPGLAPACPRRTTSAPTGSGTGTTWPG